MPISFFDRVKETSTTTGTGSFTLAGAVTGFRAFSSVLSTGSTNTTVYVIANDTANQWEIGLGYLSASTTLVRSVIYRNSSGTTTALNFSAGTKNVFITQPAKFNLNNHMLSDNVAGSPESRSNFTALGYNTTIGGDSTTAVGSSSSANAVSATAIGASATASGTYSAAVGVNATASGASSNAFGQGSSASNTNANAIGNNASASSTSTTAVGNASVASGSTSTAIGASANATSTLALALGYGAYANGPYAPTALGASSAAGGNYTVAIGQAASAQGGQAIAIGGDGTSAASDYSIVIGAYSSTTSGYQGGIAIGNNADVTYANFSIAIGSNSNAQSDNNIAMGYGTTTSGGNNNYAFGDASTASGGNSTVIGYAASSGGYSNALVIGNNLTAAQPSATYMNRFRTGITPVGTAWTLMWDDSTKEVYADPGAAPGGLNWVGYQDNGFSMLPLALNVPSGSPTTSNPNSSYFFTPGGASPTGPWSYVGYGGSGIGNVYSTTSYPITSPLSGFNFSGPAIIYIATNTTDAGTSFTMPIATGSSGYSNYSSSLNMYGGFPVMGATRYGHYIAVIQGNYPSSFSANPGCTLAGEFYDAYFNNTYYFIDVDSSAVSNLSSGAPVGAMVGGTSVTYIAFFWYNYS